MVALFFHFYFWVLQRAPEFCRWISLRSVSSGILLLTVLSETTTGVGFVGISSDVTDLSLFTLRMILSSSAVDVRILIVILEQVHNYNCNYIIIMYNVLQV